MLVRPVMFFKISLHCLFYTNLKWKVENYARQKDENIRKFVVLFMRGIPQTLVRSDLLQSIFVCVHTIYHQTDSFGHYNLLGL
jgi:hypothetical protein